VCSRRDKKAQRKSFREIEASVLENEPPEEVLSYRNRSFRLTSWAKIVQVEALRDALQVCACAAFDTCWTTTNTV
jgi:hypothetical protein